MRIITHTILNILSMEITADSRAINAIDKGGTNDD